MQEIKAMFDEFGVSEPIFKVTLSEDKSYLSLKPLNKYRPSLEGVTDPVRILAINHYSEQYSTWDKRFHKKDQSLAVYRAICSAVNKIYLQNSPLKSPKQSKIYRWLRSLSDSNNAAIQNGIITLFRYAYKNGARESSSFSFPLRSKDPHAINFLTVLEKMMNKYGA